MAICLNILKTHIWSTQWHSHDYVIDRFNNEEKCKIEAMFTTPLIPRTLSPKL